jgi:hypothetical protein
MIAVDAYGLNASRYKNCLHGIEARDLDVIDESVVNWKEAKAELGETLHRDTRVSLTIRIVPVVKEDSN